MHQKSKSNINIPLLRLKYTDEEIKFVQDGVKDILKSGYLTMGSKVKEFEEEFSNFIDSKYAVAVNSGTSSLEIPLRVLGVANKTVIIPDMDAGCSLADSAPASAFRDWLSKYPDHIVISYINCSADV